MNKHEPATSGVLDSPEPVSCSSSVESAVIARPEYASTHARSLVADAPRGHDRMRTLIDMRWAIIVLLFGVSAAFGLPLLWVSHAFSTTGKIVLSVVVVIYTLLLCWFGWWLCLFVWTQITSLFG